MNLSGPLQALCHQLAQSHLFAFDQLQRDRWMTEQVHGVPEGPRLRDARADSPPYRELRARRDYSTRDVAQLNNEQPHHGG